MNPQVALHVAICRCHAPCEVYGGKAMLGPLEISYGGSLWLVRDTMTNDDPHGFADAEQAVRFTMRAYAELAKLVPVKLVGGPADGGVLRTKLSDIPNHGALMPYRRVGGRQSHMYRFAGGRWVYMGIEAIIEELTNED